MALKVNLVYGDTGSTKTSRLGDAAEYYSRKFGRPVRGVFSDTGGYGAIQHLVDDGTVDAFVLTHERGDTLIEDMDKLSKGWWPRNSEDPKSVLAPPDLSKVSALLFDGATSWCQMMMTFHEGAVKYVQQSDSVVATGVRVPEMPKDSYIRSGEYVRRFTGRSDYGGVQARIKEFIRNSAMLAVPSEWTALETKGSDETKRPIGGPDFIGQALTGVCGPWFGNILHLDFIEKEQVVDVAGSKTVVRIGVPHLFTRSHQKQNDPTKLFYMAKVRIDKRLWDKVPSVMEARLDKFYFLLDELSDDAKRLGSPLVTAGAK